jgi:two-component SAPR family response regulator
MNIIILDNHKLIITEIRRQVLSVLPTAVCVCFTKQREAIEYVKKHRVDVALLDVDMPGLNGIEVAELMCQINPRLNIIFVTGYPEYALQAFTVPVSDFIVKPVSEDALRASFQKLRFPLEETIDSFQYDDVRDAKAIGERLRTLRKERGLTARELADEIGVSYTTIYRWENGERIPDGFNMGKLMNVLGVRMKDIISDIDIDLQNNSGGEQD